MKKIFAIMLALVLVLAMAAPAMAATITIDPQVPTDAQGSGETYKAYLIFKASFEGDTLNTATPVSYTIEETSPFYTVIDNYKVNVGGAETKVFKLEQINTSGVYNVTKNCEYDAEDLAAKLIAVITESTPVAGQAITPNDKGNYVISDLDKGYYIVTSTLGSKLIIDTLGDVSISTKNSYPSLTKKIVASTADVDSITADYGDTVTFKITVNIPDSVNGDIVVHDTLDSAFTLVTPSGLPAGVTYRTATEETDACSFEFLIDYDAVTKDANKNVTFNYTATLNKDVTTATAHKNTAWLSYSGFTSVKDEVTVTTYKIDVFKYTGSADNKTGLAGAEFVLKNSEGMYFAKTVTGVDWVNAVDSATVYTTAADNTYTVTFAGLAAGTYTLVEKTAPVGYNKANDVLVTITNADYTGSSRIEVLNSTGSELPSTGGIGTTIFYVVGGLLMAAAVVLLVTKKKVASSK